MSKLKRKTQCSLLKKFPPKYIFQLKVKHLGRSTTKEKEKKL
jgi:hypothetical protein